MQPKTLLLVAAEALALGAKLHGAAGMAFGMVKNRLGKTHTKAA
jgi:hypothetical protein